MRGEHLATILLPIPVAQRGIGWPGWAWREGDGLNRPSILTDCSICDPPTLSSHGYLIQTFALADDFLQSDRIDGRSCVIADVQMPGMSGLDLLTHMHAQGYTVPFIFITVFFDESVRARALKVGAIGFLAKPFAGPVLIDCIEAALNRDRGPGK
jgi:FixJ family two-component response regulator